MIGMESFGLIKTYIEGLVFAVGATLFIYYFLTTTKERLTNYRLAKITTWRVKRLPPDQLSELARRQATRTLDTIYGLANQTGPSVLRFITTRAFTGTFWIAATYVILTIFWVEGLFDYATFDKKLSFFSYKLAQAKYFGSTILFLVTIAIYAIGVRRQSWLLRNLSTSLALGIAIWCLLFVSYPMGRNPFPFAFGGFVGVAGGGYEINADIGFLALLFVFITTAGPVWGTAFCVAFVAAIALFYFQPITDIDVGRNYRITLFHGSSTRVIAVMCLPLINAIFDFIGLAIARVTLASSPLVSRSMARSLILEMALAVLFIAAVPFSLYVLVTIFDAMSPGTGILSGFRAAILQAMFLEECNRRFSICTNDKVILIYVLSLSTAIPIFIQIAIRILALGLRKIATKYRKLTNSVFELVSEKTTQTSFVGKVFNGQGRFEVAVALFLTVVFFALLNLVSALISNG